MTIPAAAAWELWIAILGLDEINDDGVDVTATNQSQRRLNASGSEDMLMKAGGRIMGGRVRGKPAGIQPDGLCRWRSYRVGGRRALAARGPRHRCDIRFAQRPEYDGLMLAEQATSGKTVNRMLHINRHSEDLLSKLEAVRLCVEEAGAHSVISRMMR